MGERFQGVFSLESAAGGWLSRSAFPGVARVVQAALAMPAIARLVRSVEDAVLSDYREVGDALGAEVKRSTVPLEYR